MRQNVNLVTSILALGRGIADPLAPAVKVEILKAGNFPFEYPDTQDFFITQIAMVNKYDFDPPAYDSNGRMEKMYFQTSAWTVSSHHPMIHFDPPYRYRGGKPFRGWINNGQTEDQYVFVYVGGYLEDKA